MRTDRELLELAAKAAGIQVLKWSANHAGGEIGRGLARNEEWNPLNDDGDALRLAVVCSMDLIIISDLRFTQVEYEKNRVDAPEWLREDHGADPHSATRRAIVRAAAEIGAAM